MTEIVQENPARAVWRKLNSPVGAALLTVALLAPFLNKAYHIDDTLFLRLAQHIWKEPLRPCNFFYLWDTQPRSFWVVTQNPPLGGYLIAGLSFITNVERPEEWKLHLAYLAIAAGCAALGYVLARRFCGYPMLVSVATIVSPAFLVSATSVMADVPMLLFWLLAVWCGVRYVESSRWWWVLAAGTAASLAAMSKYFGVAVVPLLAVYCFPAAGWRRLYALLPLLLPFVVLALWGWHSYIETEKLIDNYRRLHADEPGMYETQPLFHPIAAARYSSAARAAATDTRLEEIAHTFSYVGGALLWPLLLIPLAFKLHKWGWSLLILAGASGLLSRFVWLGIQSQAAENNETFNLSGQVIGTFGVMLAAGLFITLLAAESVWKRFDWNSVLLGLWYFGTLTFCLFFNWTINARIILPAVLPAGLLVVRLIEAQPSPAGLLRWSRWSLVPVLGVSFLLALADYDYAGAGRTFSRSGLMRDLLRRRPVYFAGHWGFQYYMEQAGARPINYSEQNFRPGTVFVYPLHNSGVDWTKAPQQLVMQTHDQFRNSYFFHPMSFTSYSGFYSSFFGILPFNYDKDRYSDFFIVTECVDPRRVRRDTYRRPSVPFNR